MDHDKALDGPESLPRPYSAEWLERYYAALMACHDRYSVMAADVRAPDGTAAFLEEYRDSVDRRLPLCKLNRWLGFIQNDLIAAGITTVKAERDWTRPLFRPLDFA